METQAGREGQSGVGRRESVTFGKSPDFQGCNIEYVALDVHLVDITKPRHWVDMTLSVYGTPEPATLGLMAAGLVAICLKRRRSA
ncbi:MAG: PEP-CTERM sorting domain-containing protein [Phycisphaerae bacterium]